MTHDTPAPKSPLAAQRSVVLHGEWEGLRHVQRAVEHQFTGCSDDFKNAATMAATELAENVLAHGAEFGSGIVTISEDGGEAVISTQNRSSAAAARSLRERIARIADGDPRELFIGRMLELMEQPEAGRSGLGLIRVVYEGGFRLSCDVLGDRVHIHARRRVDHALPN